MLKGRQYKYEALPSPKSFRMLRISTGPWDAPLRCQLNVTLMEEKPSYSALSYVWGKSAPNKYLHIDDRIISIRQNLFDAIRRLRMRGATNVWIDAICIDQNNNDERVAQVMLMRQIYESAEGVFVYLGESKESSQIRTLLDSLLRFGADWSMEIKNYNTPIHSIDWSDLTKYGLPDVLDAKWRCLIHLLEHPWFQRVWTFQESLVARKCRLLYGDLIYDQQDFFVALHFMNNHGFASYIDREKRDGLSPVTTSIYRCMAIFSRQNSMASPFVSQTWVRSPLIQLLRDTASAEATDARDNVFALLGVSYEAEETGLRPDYDENLGLTYMRIAKYLVNHGFGPLVLNSALITQSTLGSRLSSWVPRWGEKGTSVFSYRPKDMCVTKVFKAARHTVPVFRIQNNLGSLVVRGIVLDTIKCLGTNRHVVKSGYSVDHLDEHEMTAACLSEILIMFGDAKLYHDGGSLLEVISRLSVCDLSELDQKAPTDFQTGLRAYVAFLIMQLLEREQLSRTHWINATFLGHVLLGDTWPLDIEARQWARYFQVTAWIRFRRNIRCLTQKGYLGQIGPHAQIGDTIVMMQGCEIPYLLRRLSTNQYSLVGDCYVHGIMYGEAWDEKEVQDLEIA